MSWLDLSSYYKNCNCCYVVEKSVKSMTTKKNEDVLWRHNQILHPPGGQKVTVMKVAPCLRHMTAVVITPFA